MLHLAQINLSSIVFRTFQTHSLSALHSMHRARGSWQRVETCSSSVIYTHTHTYTKTKTRPNALKIQHFSQKQKNCGFEERKDGCSGQDHTALVLWFPLKFPAIRYKTMREHLKMQYMGSEWGDMSVLDQGETLQVVFSFNFQIWGHLNL